MIAPGFSPLAMLLRPEIIGASNMIELVKMKSASEKSVAKAFPPLLSQGHKLWMMPRYGAGDLVVNEENMALYVAGLKRRLSRGRAPAAVSNDGMQVAAE